MEARHSGSQGGSPTGSLPAAGRRLRDLLRSPLRPPRRMRAQQLKPLRCRGPNTGWAGSAYLAKLCGGCRRDSIDHAEFYAALRLSVYEVRRSNPNPVTNRMKAIQRIRR